MEEINEPQVVEQEVEEEIEEPAPETSQPVDWEKRAKTLEEKAIAQRERTKMLKSEIEKLKKQVTPKQPESPKDTTGELSDSQYLLLEVKGITDDAEIELFQKFKKETGKSDREILNNKYFKAELEDFRQDQKNRAATPSSTRRGGQAETNSVDHWMAKIESGNASLSDIKDFGLRAQVVEARERKSGDTTLPSWRR